MKCPSLQPKVEKEEKEESEESEESEGSGDDRDDRDGRDGGHHPDDVRDDVANMAHQDEQDDSFPRGAEAGCELLQSAEEIQHSNQAFQQLCLQMNQHDPQYFAAAQMAIMQQLIQQQRRMYTSASPQMPGGMNVPFNPIPFGGANVRQTNGNGHHSASSSNQPSPLEHLNAATSSTSAVNGAASDSSPPPVSSSDQPQNYSFEEQFRQVRIAHAFIFSFKLNRDHARVANF